MSNDKDDLFTADDEFAGMTDDFFGGGGVQEKKKVKMPTSIPANEPVKSEVEEAIVEEAVAEEVEAVEEAVVEEAVAEEAIVEEAIVEEAEEAVVEAVAEEAVVEEAVVEQAVVEEAVAETVVEVVVEPVVEEAVVEPTPVPKKASPKPVQRKRISKPLSPKQKIVNNIKRKAGIDDGQEIPTLDELLREKQGTRVKISDLAVFIKEPENEVLKDLFKNMPNINRVNLSACVDVNRVKVVGGQILGAGRMYQPIQVANIDGVLECTSGRHRLVFLALMYGPDAEILAYIEKMNLNEARDAVVVANMARKAKAMEQAEHAVLQAVGGDTEADRDDMYNKTVTTKAKAKKYCTYSVLQQQKPISLDFTLGTKKEGGIATIRTIEGFWGSALDWHRDMNRDEFDEGLKKSIEFMNELAEEFQENASFEAEQHMASMTMTAIGKYYKTMADAGVEVPVERLVSVVVAMGEIGRQKSDATYTEIVKAMKK
jgi:hypothetical protein